jgi:hypothetical protein
LTTTNCSLRLIPRCAKKQVPDPPHRQSFEI